jgi:hypothetical protein
MLEHMEKWVDKVREQIDAHNEELEVIQREVLMSV